MEKISALIDKLQELKNSAAGLQTISYYTQLLQAEILHQRNLQKQQELRGNGHVAVIMPAHVPVVERQAAPPVPPPQEIPAPEKAQPPVQEKVLQANGYAPDRVPVKPARPEERPSATLFDPPPPVQPKPAEPQQTQPKQPAEHANGIRKELNDLVGKQAPSLNDKLRKENLEVGEKLGGIGIKDLRGAIGINDKFLFIQELFRGDKDMYERSLKTINESASLQDAEYWIERELKIKLGWDESDHAVSQFYSLVRKRFS
ncbi:hypothetical protein ACFOTA_00820 [Chitinophaga sp. GCM10012297]|uniref:Uncharacterized protein n=1 Tax=Chitinophaga chungangae TaxID=2821488 RepID=A0ABS3Y7T3_9BACT|nr:hypothetical protein [Chitinophaga chungangae]MBO9150734.1 hypothetical protein [Chitinophaga chungangae]